MQCQVVFVELSPIERPIYPMESQVIILGSYRTTAQLDWWYGVYVGHLECEIKVTHMPSKTQSITHTGELNYAY